MHMYYTYVRSYNYTHVTAFFHPYKRKWLFTITMQTSSSKHCIQLPSVMYMLFKVSKLSVHLSAIM